MAEDKRLEEVLQVLSHPPAPVARPQQEFRPMAERVVAANSCVGRRPQPERFEGWQGHWEAERAWQEVREQQQAQQEAQPMAQEEDEQPMAEQRKDREHSVDSDYRPTAQEIAAVSAAVAIPQAVAPAHEDRVPDAEPQQQLPRLRITIGSLRTVRESASAAVTVSSGSSGSMGIDTEDGAEAPHLPVEVTLNRRLCKEWIFQASWQYTRYRELHYFINISGRKKPARVHHANMNNIFEDATQVLCSYWQDHRADEDLMRRHLSLSGVGSVANRLFFWPKLYDMERSALSWLEWAGRMDLWQPRMTRRQAERAVRMSAVNTRV